MRESTATVYVVDDSEDNVTVYTWMLESAGYQTKSFNSGPEFLQENNLEGPGCVLLDNQMPEMSGIQVQQQLIKRGTGLPIIFMSGASSYQDVADAVRSGAHAFLEKPFHRRQLLQAVKAAIKSDEQRSRQERADRQIEGRFARLTRREEEVCRLVIDGYTNRDIAEKLCISTSTVEFHRSNLMTKLGVTRLSELIKHAVNLVNKR